MSDCITQCTNDLAFLADKKNSLRDRWEAASRLHRLDALVKSDHFRDVVIENVGELIQEIASAEAVAKLQTAQPCNSTSAPQTDPEPVPDVESDTKVAENSGRPLKNGKSETIETVEKPVETEQDTNTEPESNTEAPETVVVESEEHAQSDSDNGAQPLIAEHCYECWKCKQIIDGSFGDKECKKCQTKRTRKLSPKKKDDRPKIHKFLVNGVEQRNVFADYRAVMEKDVVFDGTDLNVFVEEMLDEIVKKSKKRKPAAKAPKAEKPKNKDEKTNEEIEAAIGKAQEIIAENKKEIEETNANLKEDLAADLQALNEDPDQQKMEFKESTEAAIEEKKEEKPAPKPKEVPPLSEADIENELLKRDMIPTVPLDKDGKPQEVQLKIIRSEAVYCDECQGYNVVVRLPVDHPFPVMNVKCYDCKTEIRHAHPYLKPEDLKHVWSQSQGEVDFSEVIEQIKKEHAEAQSKPKEKKPRKRKESKPKVEETPKEEANEQPTQPAAQGLAAMADPDVEAEVEAILGETNSAIDKELLISDMEAEFQGYNQSERIKLWEKVTGKEYDPRNPVDEKHMIRELAASVATTSIGAL